MIATDARSPALTAGRRAGSLVLSLFAVPLNVRILRALTGRPLRLVDLREATGNPAQTTLRGRVRKLLELGALEKRGRGGKRSAEYELSELGLELLFVADVLEAWLARAPRGPIALGSEQGEGAIKALARGWESAILRALGTRPLALTALDRIVQGVTYPTLERRLVEMQEARQIEVVTDQRHRTLYRLTEWARQAVAPLSAAERCERRHLGAKAEPLSRPEAEAAFLLAMPLVSLPASARGSCLLAIHTGGPAGDSKAAVAGACVEAKGGRVASCNPELPQNPRSWALGTVETWLDALVDGTLTPLRTGGADPKLARDLVAGIHEALFG